MGNLWIITSLKRHSIFLLLADLDPSRLLRFTQVFDIRRQRTVPQALLFM